MRKDLAEYKDLYISESEDHLQKLNEKLLALENDLTNTSLLDQLMMSAHTIKGSSAAMGFTTIAYLAHVMEDVFDFARKDQLELEKKIIEVVFQSVDSIEQSIESIKDGNDEVDSTQLANQLKKITGVQTEEIGPSVKSSKDVTSTKVEASSSKQDATKRKDGIDASQKDDEKKPPLVQQKELDFIKVPTERLDKLVELMEQLLINKMRLENLVDPETKEREKQDIPLEELQPIVDHLSRLVSDIQYSVIQARLVPVGQIFARFPRMMRDLSRQSEKEIEFEIIGEDIELDRTIIDKLADPLVHLLRNAVDHGIDKDGTIKLIARREKDFAQIIIEDSGKGIDVEKVKQSAIDRNLIEPLTASNLSRNEIIDLIFNPNLSTKEDVTQTSGRGVGLSVVKTFINQIRGGLIVDTPINNNGGTRFTLELPLTLAIINALLVRVGEHLFAVPFASIERSVSVYKKDIKSMADQDVAVIGDQEVPLVRLKKIFRLEEEVQDMDEETVVLVERGQNTAGLVVDELVSEQEIMVKPLSPILDSAKGFSGSTVLGSGHIVLILDINSLLENTSRLVR